MKSAKHSTHTSISTNKPLQWLLVFILTVAFEAFYAMYTFAAANHHPIAATANAVAMTCTGSLSTYLFVKNPWLLVPEVLGVIIGTYFAVAYS